MMTDMGQISFGLDDVINPSLQILGQGGQDSTDVNFVVNLSRSVTEEETKKDEGISLGLVNLHRIYLLHKTLYS